jgi:hypothetical protein
VRRHALGAEKLSQLLVGLGADQVLPVHAEGRHRVDAQLAGSQPILVDGRLERLSPKSLIQAPAFQPDGLGRRGQRLDRVQVLPVNEIGPELFFRSFNTPGNEVAPGSDEIGEYFQDLAGRSLFHFADPLPFLVDHRGAAC